MFKPYAHAFQLLVLFLFTTIPIHAAEPPKILVAVTEKDQSRDAEHLPAKGFVKSGFQVILSG